MVVLIIVGGTVLVGMSFATLGPLLFVQAGLTGLVGGLLQMKFAKVKVTVREEQPTAPVEEDLDAVFDVILWDERVLAWIVASALGIFLLASLGELIPALKSAAFFLFLAGITSASPPLLQAWRSAKPKAKPGLMLGAVVAGIGGIVMGVNSVLNHGPSLKTVIAPLATGWLLGGGLVWLGRTRRMKLSKGQIQSPHRTL